MPTISSSNADALSRTTPGNEIFRYVSTHTMKRLKSVPGDPATCSADTATECVPDASTNSEVDEVRPSEFSVR